MAASPSPPPRPSALQEALSSRLFRFASPRLSDGRQPRTPRALAPFEAVEIPRRNRPETLSGVWFSAGDGNDNGARGTVLLLHPWLQWGQSYFHRRGRIDVLRQAGYHCLTVDLPGFGDSPQTPGLYDLAVEDVLDFLEPRTAGLPLHLWGVSSGGYWAHPVLSRRNGVAGAVFEDVSPHLFEWGWRQTPWFAPCFLFFRAAFRSSYRFLDLRRHAPHLRTRAVAYVAGDRDPGIPARDTRRLAAAAGAECLLVAGAGHLESIKQAGDEVRELALKTFRRAERG